MTTHNIVIKNHTETNSPVIGDANRIEQVIINFIDNAIKYAPASTEIIIEVSEANGEVTLSVTDFGDGIEADKIPFLFNRYYRVNPPDFHYSGLGLGLYISKEIIEAHRGRIGLISEPGKGSTFWFSLPVKVEETTPTE
jgi:signal transduction histidine kinase